MANALDMFRAQRDAAEQVQASLQNVASLLEKLTVQVDALAGNQALRAVVQNEQTLLARAEAFLVQVRYVREQEVARFWPAVWRRWVLALVFAVISAAAAGAGFAWTREPANEEISDLRMRAEVADTVVYRMRVMTPAERRQLDALMKWNAPPNPQ